MTCPDRFHAVWTCWHDRDAGAVIEVQGTSAVVCFVGFTPDHDPDMTTAEYICELHNQRLLDELHPAGQLDLAKVRPYEPRLPRRLFLPSER